MAKLQIPYERLLRQRIAGAGLKKPADVTRWMGAVQAQDYGAAKWALGVRTEACTEAEVEAAFTAGEIVRTHVMRPTWHFIASEDIDWMQALTSPRVHAASAYQYRQLELTAALVKRSNAAFEKALSQGQQLTRVELGAALSRAGIQATGLRLTYLVMRAELDAVICSGGRRGKQFTYALVDERAPNPRKLPRDEALAVLTERYFTSHGPATLKDYAWWSGLASADVRQGLEMVKSRLVREELDRQVYWMTPSAPEVRFPRTAVYLLPNFDEYVVGYTGRSAIFDDQHARYLDVRQSPLAQHIVLISGRIAGTWKRAVAKDSLMLEVKLFSPPSKAEARSLRLAAERVAAFLGVRISDFRF